MAILFLILILCSFCRCSAFSAVFLVSAFLLILSFILSAISSINAKINKKFPFWKLISFSRCNLMQSWNFNWKISDYNSAVVFAPWMRSCEGCEIGFLRKVFSVKRSVNTAFTRVSGVSVKVYLTYK